MDDSQGVPIRRPRRSSSRAHANGHHGHGSMYRRDSNLSTTSFLDEVEMAQDEMFAGPMGESVPTSVTSFAHRRSRADSTASFTYFPDEGEPEPSPFSEDDSAIVDDECEMQFPDDEDAEADLEAGELAEMQRTSSGYSGASVHDRLLRSDSAKTDASNLGPGHRVSQKIYVVTEDLTIVIAGFRTSTVGFALYATICVITLGLGYLLLRWLPRWQVRLTGKACPLRDCDWVVIEVSIANALRVTSWLGSLLCSILADRYRTNGANS